MEFTEALKLNCRNLQPTFITTQEIAMNMLQVNEEDGSRARDILCLSSFKDSNTTLNCTQSVTKTVNSLETSIKSMSGLEPVRCQTEEENHNRPKAIKNTETEDIEKRVRNYLESHIATFHDTTKEYRCSACDHATNSKRYLMHHYQLAHGFLDVFSCADCDFKSPTLLRLRAHIEDTHKSDSCVRKKRDSLQLSSAHVGEQHKRDEINTCLQCPFTTRWRSHLYLHVKQKHTEAPAVVRKCGECSFTTRWRSHLYKHLKDKHSKVEAEQEARTFRCRVCDFSTRHQSHLYKHRKTKHPDVTFNRERPGRKRTKEETRSEAVSRSKLEAESVAGDATGSNTFSSVWESFAASLTRQVIVVDDESENESFGNEEASKRPDETSNEDNVCLSEASKHPDVSGTHETSKRPEEASVGPEEQSKHLDEAKKCPDEASKCSREASSRPGEADMRLHDASKCPNEARMRLDEVDKRPL